MLAENLANALSQSNSLDDDILSYIKELRFGDVHLKVDLKTGLIAIVAIHNTKLGPSLGGCRLREYASFNDALRDAVRLAQGMSYKNAMAGLPLGGGKSVLLKPTIIRDREAFFETFGNFINELGGRYITAVDSGTSPSDMDYVVRKTKFVTCTSNHNGDPSPYTARGVRFSMEAALQHKFGKVSFDGLHVAIQGVGHVGYYLAQELHARGAKLTITDVSQDAIKRCVDEFGATVVTPDQIHKIECDIYAPCALGAILNDITIPQIKAPMIIGAANNQLAERRHGKMLFDRGIIYGPDYVVNCGGVIHAAAEYFQTSLAEVDVQVSKIHQTILTILERSDKEKLPTSEIADVIAEEKLYGDH